MDANEALASKKIKEDRLRLRNQLVAGLPQNHKDPDASQNSQPACMEPLHKALKRWMNLGLCILPKSRHAFIQSCIARPKSVGLRLYGKYYFTEEHIIFRVGETRAPRLLVPDGFVLA